MREGTRRGWQGSQRLRGYLSEKGGFNTLKGGDRRELLVSVGKNFPETAAKAVETIWDSESVPLTGHLFWVSPGEKGPHTCASRNDRMEYHSQVTFARGIYRAQGGVSRPCCKSRPAAPVRLSLCCKAGCVFLLRVWGGLGAGSLQDVGGLAGRTVWIYW